MITANFCKCLKCDTVLFDENPQVDAIEYDVEVYPDAKEMDRDIEGYPVCPNCMTDGNLIDL